jgi:DmsE family decaheme c-type cytochrome
MLDRRFAGPLLVALVFGAGSVAAAEEPPPPAAHATAAFSADGADSCLKCHDADKEVPVLPIFLTPHGSRALDGSPFAADDKQCESCHGASGEHAKRLRRNEVRADAFAFDPKVDPIAKIDGKCLGCHDGQHRDDWEGGVHQRADVSCVGCHDVHARRDPMLDPKLQVDTCTTCHRETLAEIRKISAHPLRDGQMRCSDCHAGHGARDADGMLVRETKNLLCFDCHADKRGPFLWEHEPAAEDCTTCHKPHGSNHRGLLARSAPLLCQSCHSQAGHPSAAFTSAGLPSGTASAYLLARSCMNCHSQVHGSNHPSGSGLSR